MRPEQRRVFMTAMQASDPFAYRKTWLHTIYIATTGNDTTGNGTKANPYKTFTKAMTVAVAGDGILAADGTYNETSGAGIAGYWTIAKSFASWVVIEPELGAAGAVTVCGTAGCDINVYFITSASAYIKFRYLTFTNVAGSTTPIRMNTASSNIYFDHCTIAGAAGSNYGFYASAYGATNFTFSYCTWTAVAGANPQAVYLSMRNDVTGWLFDHCDIASGSTGKAVASAGTTGGSVSFTNCTMTAKYPLFLDTGGDFTFTNCTMTVTAGSNGGVIIGKDGVEVTANVATATLTNCTVNKTAGDASGHAVLFGAGVVASVADNVTIAAACDYALVVKQNSGVEVKNCHLTGGALGALFFKGTTAANAHDNVLTAAAGNGFIMLQDPTGAGRKCLNWQLQTNTINVSGSAKALNIGTSAADDAGGGICDYNTYKNNSGLGKCRADNDVQSLLELQATWADYDVTTNDSHSTVV